MLKRSVNQLAACPSCATQLTLAASPTRRMLAGKVLVTVACPRCAGTGEVFEANGVLVNFKAPEPAVESAEPAKVRAIR